ncbi:hypothetical protein WG68_02010 [Arsukibacterium ikkense]|uniref:OLD protein-like TOPRIM domain-containing protein n=1 Tax=Arsukibacterium ikkense TaxID=336831 RepID=A0A0M2V9Y5_9GAMM|nr:TOPRIM nucleotidyl transferase/hydrolase domain-containing protein [Arsukibacterium ikkense]KKO47421.1 hypothetical protein WG68_02010 [Arsukibacterium ikkense]
MATTIEDIMYDEMINELHYEAVMKNAALDQCIYIFVEGESEEATFQILLEDQLCGLDFEKNGVVVANYNGIGNLGHAVRLLRKTLSHDRPIVVTYDDDLEGKRKLKYLNDPLITPFKMPQTPVVEFRDGSWGGSFEEVFSPDCFLKSCFEGAVLPETFTGSLSGFTSSFDTTKPWTPQLAKYASVNGCHPASINKVLLAENMAHNCDPVPDSFIKLAETVLNLRKQNPVKHPADIDLPI